MIALSRRGKVALVGHKFHQEQGREVLGGQYLHTLHFAVFLVCYCT
jgi:hypothetical protein